MGNFHSPKPLETLSFPVRRCGPQALFELRRDLEVLAHKCDSFPISFPNLEEPNMTSHVLSLHRGKNGAIQNFSTSHQPDPVATRLLQAAMGADVDPQRCQQTLSDPTTVHQFACVWDGRVGFLTRPTLHATRDDAFVIGSFCNCIRQAVPVSVLLWLCSKDFSHHSSAKAMEKPEA